MSYTKKPHKIIEKIKHLPYKVSKILQKETHFHIFVSKIKF